MWVSPSGRRMPTPLCGQQAAGVVAAGVHLFAEHDVGVAPVHDPQCEARVVVPWPCQHRLLCQLRARRAIRDRRHESSPRQPVLAFATWRRHEILLVPDGQYQGHRPGTVAAGRSHLNE